MDDPAAVVTSTAAPGGPVEVLDLRSEPPPQPLVQTLERLADLPEETVLLQRNDRVPQLLFPKLDDRGYSHETIEEDDEVHTVIWRD